VLAPDEPAVALVAPYCDIIARLNAIPPSARLRGVYFRSVEAQLEKRGKHAQYRRYFPNDGYADLPFYSVAEYLVRVACAGALVASPSHVHEGIHEIARSNSTAFVSSLLGRSMLGLLARDPVRLTEQGLAARRQSHTYGHWEIVRHGERAIEMVYRDEYCWLESVVTGAARGTFEACGLDFELETKLSDRFNGSTCVRW
jgi:uncharacterized protein (TIGR02265 family)